jgi:protein subunit release factor B
MALIIAPDVVIPDEELEWKFIRSSGPGGQNVNKVASAAQLRFLLPLNVTLPATVRNRLRRIAGQRLIDDGSILFKSMSERTQEGNRRAGAGAPHGADSRGHDRAQDPQEDASDQGFQRAPHGFEEAPRRDQAAAHRH